MIATDNDAAALDEIQQVARDQFARQSQRYGKGHILADVSDVETAFQHISLPPRARVLDVAAGAGHTGLYLASLGYDVTLSDLAYPILQRAADAAAARGRAVRLPAQPAAAPPSAAESADLGTARCPPPPFGAP